VPKVTLVTGFRGLLPYIFAGLLPLPPSGVAAKRHAIRQSTVSLFHDNPELHPYGVETKLGIGCGSPVGQLERLDGIRA
jgi:hypothetical protein